MTTRVLLIGKTGVGKSAVAKALLGGDPRPGDIVLRDTAGKEVTLSVNDSARGVTFTCSTYVSVKGDFTVTDTVGFGEGEQGNVSSRDAMMKLRELLSKSKEGYHAILYVCAAGRITATDEAIFAMFADILMPDLRPNFKFVVTNCDNNENWVDENHEVLLQVLGGRLGAEPSILPVAFPFVKDANSSKNKERATLQEDLYRETRKESTEKLLAFITTNRPELKIPATASADIWTIGRLWRLLMHKLRLDTLKDAFYDALLAIGWKRQDVDKLMDEDIATTVAQVFKNCWEQTVAFAQGATSIMSSMGKVVDWAKKWF